MLKCKVIYQHYNTYSIHICCISLLQKNKAVKLYKEATKQDVRYAHAQKRIDALEKRLKVIKLK